MGLDWLDDQGTDPWGLFSRSYAKSGVWGKIIIHPVWPGMAFLFSFSTQAQAPAPSPLTGIGGEPIPFLPFPLISQPHCDGKVFTRSTLEGLSHLRLLTSHSLRERTSVCDGRDLGSGSFSEEE